MGDTNGKRIRLGLLIADLDGLYDKLVWTCMCQAAEEADCSLIAFEGRDIEAPGADRQHNIAYSMARHVRLDGYVVLGTQMCRYISHKQYERFLRPFLRRGRPLVSIGVAASGAQSILTDNRSGMDQLMDHLIVHHGYSTFAFVGGPDQNDEAVARKQSFLNAHTRHGLTVDADLVFSGDFTVSSGYAAMHRLMSDQRSVDCVVCANDNTAFGACQYLREHEKIPIKPHITGYDDTPFSRICRPALTTVRQPFADMMRVAVDAIRTPSSEADADPVVLPAELVVRASCGCTDKPDPDAADDLYLYATRGFRAYQKIHTQSLEALVEQLSIMLNDCGIQDFYFVQYSVPFTYPARTDEVREARLLYARIDGKTAGILRPVPFQTTTLLPESFLPEDRPGSKRITWVVKPLFFDDEQLGYLIFEPTSTDTRNYDAVRGQISNSLKIALMQLRQKEVENRLEGAETELQSFSNQLSVLSFKDPLSGLYNRRGFFREAEQRLSRPAAADEEFLALFIDIDHMKAINDHYGRTEGDEAIRATATLLQRTFRSEDILARIGGDEFAVLASNASPELFTVLSRRLESAVKQHNRLSGKSYRLHVSVGQSIVPAGADRDIEEILKRADTKRNESKNRRRRRFDPKERNS